ncbi:hypothetical protein I3842_01G019000 [Carya illinoinensis]|uniref:Uncharacterized protein n=1 Tax=Carya illinoinensis TaxID=32201 RepID=A0A922G107_CARIL|nr:hypothetical protein I3842_01G019000 [Carya illinoinensis]
MVLLSPGWLRTYKAQLANLLSIFSFTPSQIETDLCEAFRVF